MFVWLNRYRNVLVVLALVLFISAVFATAALGAEVDPNDEQNLWTWIVRCLVWMTSGHVDW